MAVNATYNFSTSAAPDVGPLKRRWWVEEKDDLPATLEAIIRNIRDRSTAIETQRQVSARLYGNLAVIGPAGLSFSRASQASPMRDRITYNLVQSVVDTITAKTVKNRPKPYFLTSGGDYRQQRKAKKLNRFVEGLFHELNIREIGPMAFRDAAVWGDGIVHVFAKDGRVAWERVIPSELYVDEVEGFYGSPRQMHRVKMLDRLVVLEAFPEHAAKIWEAKATSQDRASDVQSVSDQIPVAESWHLPSGPDAKYGRHIISASTVVLLDEPYTRDTFPFARMKWSKRLWGYWSMGVVEQIQNQQTELNKLLWLVQRSYHLMGSFKIWMTHDSKIATEHLNNDIGSIIRGNTAPQYLTPQVVPAEYYAHIERIVKMAYDQAGVSMLSATSEKPAGLDSGKALREYGDIESDRFQVIGQAYENFHLDLARLSIDVVRDIVGEKAKRHEAKSFVVKSSAARFLNEIDWKDIDLRDDAYVMQVFPISSLPNDPAGRLQTVQEYAQAGFLDQRAAKKLLNFPDLEAEDSLSSAIEERIEASMEAIMDGDKYIPPDPFVDLALARQMALQYYNQAAKDGAEESKLDLFRTYIGQIDALEAAAAPPAPPPGVAAPQAAPAPPPTSDLIPNVPGAPGPM